MHVYESTNRQNGPLVELSARNRIQYGAPAVQRVHHDTMSFSSGLAADENKVRDRARLFEESTRTGMRPILDASPVDTFPDANLENSVTGLPTAWGWHVT